MRKLHLCLLAVMMVLVACRTPYYAMWEKFGKHKRDLLRDEVKETQEEQKEATEQFQDALTRLKQLYGFEGGKLEETYNALKQEYDQCVQESNQVKERIRNVEQIGADLFAEWEKELDEISNQRLRSDSRSKLQTTRRKFDTMVAAMHKVERTMEPILKQFQDNVLYLKHNLNAQAIGALKGEAADIEREIERLIADMNRSIQEADSFIRAMPQD